MRDEESLIKRLFPNRKMSHRRHRDTENKQKRSVENSYYILIYLLSVPLCLRWLILKSVLSLFR
jgi:hypothetical protein